MCASPDLAKILLRNGEISDANFDKIDIRNNEDTYKDNYYIPRRRGVITTNVEVFQKEHDKLIAKRMREANRTSGKRSKKTNKQVVTSKKLRVKSTEAAEREPLLLRVPLPTDHLLGFRWVRLQY